MSRINELLELLCPDGIDTKRLSELGVSQKGVRVVRKQLKETGGYPVYQNSLIPLGYYNQSNRPAGMPFVIGAGAASQIGYSETEWWAADDCFTFDIPSDVADGRYIFFCLLDKQKYLQSRVRRASIPRLSRSVVEKLRIPLPPLEIQREVVRILDDYGNTCAALIMSKRMEMALLKQQATILCDVLVCREDFNRQPISSLGVLFRGKRFTAADYVADGIPSIHYGEVYTAYGISAKETISSVREDMRDNLRYAEPNDVIIACTGENKDDICKPVAWLGDTRVAVHDDCHIFHHSMDARYVAYALLTTEFREQKVRAATESKVVRVSGKKLASMTIPVPPIERQREIADTLDQAFSLTEQLIAELTTEIELLELETQELRTQLLTFPKKTT